MKTYQRDKLVTATEQPFERNTTKIRLRVPMGNLVIFGESGSNIKPDSMLQSDDGYYNIDISVPCAEELNMSSAMDDLEKRGYRRSEAEDLVEIMLEAVWPEMCIRALKDMIVPVRDGSYAVQEKIVVGGGGPGYD